MRITADVIAISEAMRIRAAEHAPEAWNVRVSIPDRPFVQTKNTKITDLEDLASEMGVFKDNNENRLASTSHARGQRRSDHGRLLCD